MAETGWPYAWLQRLCGLQSLLGGAGRELAECQGSALMQDAVRRCRRRVKARLCLQKQLASLGKPLDRRCNACLARHMLLSLSYRVSIKCRPAFMQSNIAGVTELFQFVIKESISKFYRCALISYVDLQIKAAEVAQEETCWPVSLRNEV